MPQLGLSNWSTLTIHIRFNHQRLLFIVLAVDTALDFFFDRFIPWSKLIQFFICHHLVWLVLKQKIKIMVNVHIVCLSHLHHGVCHGTCLGSRRGIAEQPALPSNNKWADVVLSSLFIYEDKLLNGQSGVFVSERRTGRWSIRSMVPSLPQSFTVL